MTITLTVAASTLALSPDLYWSDENAWTPVRQSVEPSLTGALLISTAALQAGRPITLQPPDDSSAWVSRSAVDQLCAWAAVPGLVLSLTLRGTARDVVFRHHDGTALDARPIFHYSDVDAADRYLVTLRFMEV